ncbi:MAG: hypothetical protein GX141_11440 [Armatimonadetes bacterium]|jgi:tetratricopeptide (TPR) repeat protein|nr:hypothetical protein [Armatimonadota bacterium]
MGANTYPDPRVSRMINEYVIPVQFNVKLDEDAPVRYHAQWTPAIIYEDAEGNEYRRSFGPLNAEQFLAEFALAHALRYYHSGQFEKSIELLEKALEHTKDDPLRYPENLYWIGPAKYESSGNVDELIQGFKALQRACPDNDWTKRSRQLKSD